MKAKVASIFLMCILFSTAYLPISFAQDFTTRALPEGAKARIGKGVTLPGGVAYAPDGTRLAVASSIGIWIYDTETYKELALLTGHKFGVRSLSFSPDGSMLASADGNVLHLWDVATGTYEQIDGVKLGGLITSAVFSPDGKTLAIGGSTTTLGLWNVEAGEFQQTLTRELGEVRKILFSPDGKTLVAEGSRFVSLWDIETGDLKHTFVGSGISFSPDGKTLAYGGFDDSIKLRDVETGTETQVGTEPTGGATYIVFSPDGGTLASTVRNNISLWDVDTGEHLQTITAYIGVVESVVFSPDGQTLLSNADRGIIHLWDTGTYTRKHTLAGHMGGVQSVALSADGQMLAAGSEMGPIHLWDVDTRTHKNTLIGHRWKVNSVSFSADSQTLASGGADGTVRLWDMETGALRNTLTGHTNEVQSVSFTPDSQTLASGSWDRTIRLWDVDAATLKNTLTGHTNRLTFSPDGQTLASSSVQGINLFDVETATLKATLTGHTAVTLTVAFSSDGQMLASGNTDGTLHLWDVPTGVHKHMINAHTEDVQTLDVQSVAFSPDGSTLASGGEDWTVRLWDTSTGEHKQTISGHTWGVTGIMFSLDGAILASASPDGTVLLWELAPVEPEPTRLAGDVTGDGSVSILDLVAVAAAFGETGETPADVNGDGQVDIRDLVAVAAAFGETTANAPSAIQFSQLSPETVQRWLTHAQQLNLTDATSQRGIRFLEQLLLILTPKETALLANYPNPFNPETWIPYQLSEPADVTLRIYAIDGTLIRTLSIGHQATGTYHNKSRSAYWDGKNAIGEPVASGVYFYTLSADDFTATRKMLIRK